MNAQPRRAPALFALYALFGLSVAAERRVQPTAVVPACLATSAATLLAASFAADVAIRLLTAKLRLMNAELERKVAARSAMLIKAEKLSALGRIDAVIKALRIYAHQDQKGEASVVSLAEQLDAALALSAGRMGEVVLRADYAALPAYRCYAEQLQQV